MIKPVIIGDATLYCGDCLSILPSLAKVDAVITDPPYGLNFASNPHSQSCISHERMDWDKTPADDKAIATILSLNIPTIIWGGNFFCLPPSQCFLIWDKMQPEQFSMAMAEMAWCSFQSPAKIFRKHPSTYSKEHPTQKPVELMLWCIRQIGDPALVLDPYMGSGSTAVACVEYPRLFTGRKFIGIEIEKKYFDIACERIDNAYRQKRMFP